MRWLCLVLLFLFLPALAFTSVMRSVNGRSLIKFSNSGMQAVLRQTDRLSLNPDVIGWIRAIKQGTKMVDLDRIAHRYLQRYRYVANIWANQYCLLIFTSGLLCISG